MRTWRCSPDGSSRQALTRVSCAALHLGWVRWKHGPPPGAQQPDIRIVIASQIIKLTRTLSCQATLMHLTKTRG